MVTFKSKRKIWITSEEGFIGSNFIKKLNKEKFDLVSTSRKDLDLNDSKKINKFLKQNKPEIIINTSGLVGGILRNKKEKYELLSENLKSSVNLIDQVYKNYENQIFINLSSSCIYPNNFKNRMKEKDLDFNNLEKSSEYYALSKIVSFKLCKELFNRGYKFYTFIPSNVYGPHDNFSLENSHVIGSLINKISNAKDKTINLIGSGIAKRDFLYIEDFVRAITFFLNNNTNKNAYYNLSSKKIISIKTLALIIKNIINPDIKIKFNNDGNDGSIFKSLDSKNFRNSFKWSEKDDIKSGISKTIEWYQSNVIDKI